MGLTISEEIYLRNLLSDFGTPVGESGLHYQVDSFTGNGATTAFTTTHAPYTDYPVFVYLNGIIQVTGFTLSGTTTVTFLSAPANGIAIQLVYEY